MEKNDCRRVMKGKEKKALHCYNHNNSRNIGNEENVNNDYKSTKFYERDSIVRAIVIWKENKVHDI